MEFANRCLDINEQRVKETMEAKDRFNEYLMEEIKNKKEQDKTRGEAQESRETREPNATHESRGSYHTPRKTSEPDSNNPKAQNKPQS